MGTASLVIGIILILGGFGIFLGGGDDPTIEWYFLFLAQLILGIPLIVVGALFLRKYDKDREKEKGGYRTTIVPCISGNIESM